MAVFYINSYDIIDLQEFSKYPPLVRPLLSKYNADVLASDLNALPLEGTARTMNAIIKFPSREAALACYNDPDYEPVKKIRQNSTANCTMILVEEWQPK